MRRAWGWLSCLALAGAGAGCGDEAARGVETDTEAASSSDAVHDGESSSGDAGLDGSGSESGPGPEDPGDPWEPPPPLDPLPPETLALIAADIDAALAQAPTAGTTLGVRVIDGATGQEVYVREPDLGLTPASNTKLFTTAAAFELLGEDHRLTTEVAASVLPDAAGVIAGDLYVIGGHDFTLSPYLFAEAEADFALRRMAETIAEAGVVAVTGQLVVGGEFVYDGDPLGTFDVPANRAAVAERLLVALGDVGISVAMGSASIPDLLPPAGAVPLTTWASPALAAAVVPINVVSHNEFADELARHVGWEISGTSTYEAGGAAILAWLGSIGVAARGVMLHDGSGLSHDNTVSARQVVDLLAAMFVLPEGLAWRRTFSIAGVRGTLGNRLLGADTWGRVWGKTGSLDGVIATSGVAFNRHDGRPYLFSLLTNGVGDPAGVRAVHDDVIAIVARDHRGLGERAPAPVLRWVRNADGPGVIDIEWAEVPEAAEYLVWLSPDGTTWARGDARLVTAAQHRAGQLPFGPDVFVRVSARGPWGESEASDVYGAHDDADTSRLLIVDGCDRWQAEPAPENPMGEGHEFAARHTLALADSGHLDHAADAAANEAIASGAIVLEDYDAVLWVLGEEGTEHETFDAGEQALIAQYLASGGALFVSGAEIGWDLVENGNAEDAAFLHDVLHAGYVGDDGGSALVRGGSGIYAFFSPGTQAVYYPDELAAAPSSEPILHYWGGTGGVAAVAHASDHRVVVLGFPFESIDNAPDRARWMAEVLDRLGWSR